MLSSRIVSRKLFGLLAACVSVVSAPIFIAGPAVAEYTNSTAYLGANTGFLVEAQAFLDTKVTTVAENVPLSTFAKSLRQVSGIEIRVEPSLSRRPVSFIADDKSYREILEDVQSRLQAFLVYRDGYLMFTEKIRVRCLLDRELAPPQLQALTAEMLHRNAELKFGADGRGATTLDATVDSAAYLKLREFFVVSGVSGTITQTNAAVLSGSVFR